MAVGDDQGQAEPLPVLTPLPVMRAMTMNKSSKLA